MPRPLNTYLMALTTVTLWGASFPLTKAALAHVGPISLAFLRWAISALALVLWLAWGKRTHDGEPALLGRLLRRNGWTITWVALSGITLFYWLENLALNYTTAINAGVLSNLTAVFIVLIATALLHERLRLLEWAAMAVAFAGAVLVSLGAGNLAPSYGGWIGDLLMVIATLFGAIYSIGGKRLTERYPATVVTAAAALIGALFLLPLAAVEGLRLDLPPSVWGIVLLLGLGASALANLWWLTILARVDASRAALALFLIPVISAALAAVLLHEPLTPPIVVGALLVLAGVMVVQRKTG